MYGVNIQSNSCDFCWYFSNACRLFCTKLFKTVEFQNTHFPPSFVEIYLKMTTLFCFNQDNPHFSAIAELSSLVVCWWLRAGLLVLKGGYKLGDGMSYCRCLKWPPMAATAMQSSVWCSSPPPCWCVFVGSSMVCRASFNSLVVLSFGWSLWYFSSMVLQT